MAIARASEARQTIAMVNRAQQAYFLERGEFTQSPADLGILLNLESEHYRFELLTQSNRSIAFVEASPRTSDMRSYVGVVAVLDNTDSGSGQMRSTLAVMCESTWP